MKIGLLFGSFDPIHIGHINLAQTVINAGVVDKVEMVVAMHNPFKEKQTDYEYRTQMCNIAIKSYPRIGVNYTESALCALKNDKVYTYKVLEEITSQRENIEFLVIVTQETYKEIKSWKNGEKILDKYHFVILNSQHLGVDDLIVPDKDVVLDIENDINISSTVIRNRLKNSISPLPFLDPEVYNYINQKKLYSYV